MDRAVYPLIYSKKKLKKTNLLINAELIRSSKTFLDYIADGMQINLSIAIDFSKTNQNLHEVEENKLNRYEEAIKYCGDIVAYYDADQLFPAFGIGADNVPEKFDRMCFPINFNENPDIEKIDGVLREYRNCLSKITLSEPCYFTPVITHITRMIELDQKIDKKNKNYHILLLLTDGKYDDREKTIDAIVKASKLPLSIIIVGLQDNKRKNIDSTKYFDIVYLIDATGSMGSYLDAAKDQCINISNELKSKFKKYEFQFGGVFYRDPLEDADCKNEMYDLSDNVASFRDFISKMKARGGGDSPEDWVGGYDLSINKISWRNGLRLICDADAHGKAFTNEKDNHPQEGDKLPPLIQQCVEKNIKIIGFNIDNYATTSFNQCKKIYDEYDKDKKGLFKIEEFKKNGNISNTFKDLVVGAATFAAMDELDGDDLGIVFFS